MFVESKHPCPVCGYLVFSGPPGSYDICPICDWEDDMVQLTHPDMAGGANKVSLIEAQQNFIKFGASEENLKDRVRPPTSDDIKDTRWRPWDPTKDAVSKTDIQSGYYWLK